MTAKTADLLGRVYGPYAFGVVSLLVIWQFVVKPELDNSRVDSQAIALIADSMRETANSLHTTTVALGDTVRTLQAVQELQNKTVDRLMEGHE